MAFSSCDSLIISPPHTHLSSEDTEAQGQEVAALLRQGRIQPSATWLSCPGYRNGRTPLGPGPLYSPHSEECSSHPATSCCNPDCPHAPFLIRPARPLVTHLFSGSVLTHGAHKSIPSMVPNTGPRPEDKGHNKRADTNAALSCKARGTLALAHSERSWCILGHLSIMGLGRRRSWSPSCAISQACCQEFPVLQMSTSKMSQVW